jgi:hypothetical protein
VGGQHLTALGAAHLGLEHGLLQVVQVLAAAEDVLPTVLTINTLVYNMKGAGRGVLTLDECGNNLVKKQLVRGFLNLKEFLQTKRFKYITIYVYAWDGLSLITVERLINVALHSAQSAIVR